MHFQQNVEKFENDANFRPKVAEAAYKGPHGNRLVAHTLLFVWQD